MSKAQSSWCWDYIYKPNLQHQREVIHHDGYNQTYIGLLHNAEVTCLLCKQHVTQALELDTAEGEYDVLHLCASCVRELAEKVAALPVGIETTPPLVLLDALATGEEGKP